MNLTISGPTYFSAICGNLSVTCSTVVLGLSLKYVYMKLFNQTFDFILSLDAVDKRTLNVKCEFVGGSFATPVTLYVVLLVPAVTSWPIGLSSPKNFFAT